MSFLTDLMGKGGAAAAAPAAAPTNPFANGLANLVGSDPSHVSDIAGRIGTGMNAVAQAGGAQPGYAPPAVGQPAAAAEPVNHMQLLDNDVLQRLIARFRPPAQDHNQMEQW